MDTSSQDPWTQAQWTQVQETVRDEAKKARVAASFLPAHGPLSPDEQTAKLQRLNIQAGQWTGEVNDYNTRRLTTLSVNVPLQHAQVMEPDLAGALVALKWAANLIARVEDRLVFMGQPGPNPPLPPELRPCFATGGAFFDGLFLTAVLQGNTEPVGLSPNGQDLVVAVSRAIGQLESRGHNGPFALVLNTRLFDVALTPVPGSLVLPADRIKPLLDGPLLRSSTMDMGPNHQGVVVSLGTDSIDCVVGSEIAVRFLQVTAVPSPRHVYRVSQRFTLRIKHDDAVVAFIP